MKEISITVNITAKVSDGVAERIEKDNASGQCFCIGMPLANISLLSLKPGHNETVPAIFTAFETTNIETT